MARKRMIDPTIWADEDFGTLTSDAMVMFIGIISNADDEGRLPGNSLYLSSSIFPYKGLTQEKAKTIRDEILLKMKSLKLYEIDGKEYLQLTNWSDYQSINRPSKSKYPPFNESSVNNHGGLTPNRIEKKGIEENRIEKNGDASPLAESMKKIAGRLSEPKQSGISKPFQDKAFRYAQYLGISLSDPELKKRWLGFIKQNECPKLDTTLSYLSDYEAFKGLEGDEARIKYFIKVFYNRS